ncbi:WAS/WASL-interacting protein family member 3-like [Homalodisca vitripennis]|uniref:WAS/WASL-interacting protein family member 3-like n=1 Tax=Homalodisca vitripennis TaxID=197043 RepID=UPI001EEA03EA|nr:WAS/WASL-interacting protein family member 3-like [Homalodisca vitripennis]
MTARTSPRMRAPLLTPHSHPSPSTQLHQPPTSRPPPPPPRAPPPHNHLSQQITTVQFVPAPSTPRATTTPGAIDPPYRQIDTLPFNYRHTPTSHSHSTSSPPLIPPSSPL